VCLLTGAQRRRELTRRRFSGAGRERLSAGREQLASTSLGIFCEPILPLELGLLPPQCLRGRARGKAIGQCREAIGLFNREAEDARGVAHGAASAPGDLLADHRRVIPAVFLVDVLQHVLAFLVREVDVDVRRFLPVLAEEALEEQVELHGIHGRDAEAEAHRGIRR